VYGDEIKYMQVQVYFENGYLTNDGSERFILNIEETEFYGSKEWLIEFKESIDDFLKEIENKEVYK